MHANLYNQTILQSKTDINAIRQRCAQAFWKQMFNGKWQRLWRQLRRKSSGLLDLNCFELTKTISTRHHLGIRTIAISDIVGSEGRTADFDADFYPLQMHNRDRWINIAAVLQMGKTLPPISLVKIGPTYFLRDGHHRVSVLRALGQLEVEAEVIEWQIDYAKAEK